MSEKLTIGGKYNWKNQPERLVYLGDNFSGNGYWHQFAKIESPSVVWCEVKGYQLSQFEETAPVAEHASEPVETVPWPTVTRYSGGASHEGIGGRVWIRLSDDGPEVEYVPASAPSGDSGQLPAPADQMHAAIAAERAKADTLKTVMVAAAEEIAAHWDAHCDDEGYGPQNLLRRLEEGIPSEYGYTAGRFAELQAELSTLRQQLAEAVRERDALRAQVDAAVPAMRDYARRNPRWESWDNGEVEGKMQDPNGVNAWLEQIDAAIAAQWEAKPPAVERELFEGE